VGTTVRLRARHLRSPRHGSDVWRRPGLYETAAAAFETVFATLALVRDCGRYILDPARGGSLPRAARRHPVHCGRQLSTAGQREGQGAGERERRVFTINLWSSTNSHRDRPGPAGHVMWLCRLGAPPTMYSTAKAALHLQAHVTDIARQRVS
jgi:hypothetical protein